MKSNLLQQINSPSDLRKLSLSELPQLASELRNFIINIVATKEGHLGASLGVVELTIALHYVFDTPNDLLVWDVGHQAYGHKILTDRKSIFHTNRQFKGISGFPKRSESPYDSFGVGHSSTSISAALGMALASNLQNNFKKHHIAVIGDASIASGMAFEGLNHAGDSTANLLVILNDNDIGIDPSVGALKNHFKKLKNYPGISQNNVIESLEFEYFGPIDGHDIELIIKELNKIKTIKGPKFLHIITTKGKGLQLAEENQVEYHAPGKFDAETGEISPKSHHNLPPKYQDVFGQTILDLAKKNSKIVGITPAMPTGSSLKLMMDVFPDRAFDVGIAEQHAVTLAAGMSTQGMVVFCNIYATFMQRAVDQIIHDVALQNLPVIFCLDRAGLVGEDGATHHGVFDIPILRCVPSMILFSPLNEIALQNILYTAQLGLSNPIAIRYPRGRGQFDNWQQNIFGKYQKINIGEAICLKKGTKIAILSNGTIGNNVINALSRIKPNTLFSHYDFSFIKPLDKLMLADLLCEHQLVITIEDGAIMGGFGSAVIEFAATIKHGATFKTLGIPDQFVEHGSINELQKFCKIDADSLSTLFEDLAVDFL